MINTYEGFATCLDLPKNREHIYIYIMYNYIYIMYNYIYIYILCIIIYMRISNGMYTDDEH